MTLLEKNVYMPLRKPAKKSRDTPSRISKARLAAMIEEATVDAYGESRRTATGSKVDEGGWLANRKGTRPADEISGAMIAAKSRAVTYPAVQLNGATSGIVAPCDR
jgi:hypothetical protein